MQSQATISSIAPTPKQIWCAVVSAGSAGFVWALSLYWIGDRDWVGAIGTVFGACCLTFSTYALTRVALGRPFSRKTT